MFGPREFPVRRVQHPLCATQRKRAERRRFEAGAGYPFLQQSRELPHGQPAHVIVSATGEQKRARLRLLSRRWWELLEIQAGLLAD